MRIIDLDTVTDGNPSGRRISKDYARVHYVLQLDDDLLLLSKEDTLGRTLQDLSLKHRHRASNKA